MARAARPAGVRGAAPGRHRSSVDRRVHRDQVGRRVRLPRLRGGAVPQHREVRVALRLAVVLRRPRLRRGDPARGPLARHGPRRSAVRELPEPPGPPVRGRGLRHPHRPALLHQLDQPHPPPRGRLSRSPTFLSGGEKGRLRKRSGLLLSATFSCEGPVTSGGRRDGQVLSAPSLR